MHAVAAHRMDVGGVLGEPGAQDLDVLLVGGVVHRVRLGHPHDEALLHLSTGRGGRARRARGSPARSGRRRRRSTGRRPRRRSTRDRDTSCPARGSSPATTSRNSGSGRPRRRGVDVDPVVGEPVGFGDHERHREEVPERQPFAASSTRAGGGGSMASTSNGIGIDDTTWEHPTRAGPSGVEATTSRARPPSWRMLRTSWEKRTSLPWPTTSSWQRSHIMPGPWRGYSNSSMRLVTSVWLRAGREGVPHRLEQREVLDPLGGPVGLDVGGRHAPDLLGVGLEEDPVEAPTEPRRGVALEGGLVGRWTQPHPRVGDDAADRLDQPEVAQCVERLEGVVVELAVVEDAAHPGAHEEVLVGQDLVPQVRDGA